MSTSTKPTDPGSLPLALESAVAEQGELPLVLESATAEHGAALVALFERTATPCYCRYWHFTGDKNAWLDRLFHAPEENRAEFLADLKGASSELRSPTAEVSTQEQAHDAALAALRGVVASHQDLAVGWLKLSPAERVDKLYQQRLYRGLPCFNGPRAGVLTIGCVLVDEAWRRRGVTRALVRRAVEIAGRTGARAIEAFPRCSDQAGAAELWTGPPAVFLEAGFKMVSDFAPYPVLRYDVSGIQK